MKRIFVFTLSFIIYHLSFSTLAYAQCTSGENGVCYTAIGDIPTSPIGFISNIFTIVLGLSGGIAILLIMFSGYQFLASTGNPEKVQAARETLTSAVIGLLFIIFSVIILQVIGVDILHIPGFSAK